MEHLLHDYRASDAISPRTEPGYMPKASARKPLDLNPGNPIEAARRRNAEKRGGGLAAITLDESMEPTATSDQELLALDGALEELGRIEPRQAAMVESRFFGGLDIAETAELLEVSEATVLRDWRSARAWLAHELRRQS